MLKNQIKQMLKTEAAKRRRLTACMFERQQKDITGLQCGKTIQIFHRLAFKHVII